MSYLVEAGGPVEDRHRLLVSIDFGTTYTGVAYCLSSENNFDKIETITTWPGSGASVEKVPTEICYLAGGERVWGQQASDSACVRQGNAQNPIYGRFKLLLDPTIGRDVYGEIVSNTQFDLGDSTARISLPYGKTAVDVSADYLRELYKHIVTILKKRMPDTLETTPIEFVFTVPAIWSHKAQEATRKAAERAGFGSSGRSMDTISMISEPEAAAIYAITDMYEQRRGGSASQFGLEELKVGENFIICDAGGGTVDLITYEVQEVFPDLKLKESVVGGGGKCGSTYIDEAFHRLLRERIGPSFDDESIWTPKKKGRGSHLMQKFETCKRTFGQSGHDMWFLELPVHVQDNMENGIMENDLELTHDDMKELFDPVVDDIIALVESQANKLKNSMWGSVSKGKLSTVILVGGFGESQYLYDRLSAWGKRQDVPLTVVNPRKSWSAIMRGAVLQALTPAIRSRKLRSHYGFQCSTKFDPAIHNSKDARLSAWNGWVWDDNVLWCARLGDDCSVDKEIEFNVFYEFRNQLQFNHTFTLELLGCRHQEAPKEESSKKVFPIGVVKMDISDINIQSLPCKVQDGVSHYRLDEVVKMRINSADATFSVWIQGKCYGKTRIRYDS